MFTETRGIRSPVGHLALSHIRLFQERLSGLQSVVAYGTKSKGIMGNSGQRLLD